MSLSFLTFLTHSGSVSSPVDGHQRAFGVRVRTGPQRYRHGHQHHAFLHQHMQPSRLPSQLLWCQRVFRMHVQCGIQRKRHGLDDITILCKHMRPRGVPGQLEWCKHPRWVLVQQRLLGSCGACSQPAILQWGLPAGCVPSGQLGKQRGERMHVHVWLQRHHHAHIDFAILLRSLQL